MHTRAHVFASAPSHGAEPCGMNVPHTHPRATEILYAANGTENGARLVLNTLGPGQATVFPLVRTYARPPRGGSRTASANSLTPSLQANEGCAPMAFVCAYGH